MSALRILERAALFAALASAACSSPDDPDAAPGDGHAGDATADGTTRDAAPRTCSHDADCDDGVFCNGAEHCSAGVCASGGNPCDDHATCTTDTCNESARSCGHSSDDSVCGDHDACNGIEHCAPGTTGAASDTGCTAVVATNVLNCDDANSCTLDSCDPTTGCIHAPRDLDGDGHVASACTVTGTPAGARGDDCDDSDPDVHPGAVEICNNGKDDDCNGSTDFQDTAVCHASNDTCATAMMLPGPGSYTGSTAGLRHDYALSCEGDAVPDVAFQFTLTQAQDVTIATTAEGGTIALVQGCAPLTELRCVFGQNGFGEPQAPSTTYHGLAAGTYQILVTSGDTAGPFGLTLAYGPASPPDPTYVVSMNPAGVTFVDICAATPHRMVLPSVDDDTVNIPETTGTPLITIPFPIRLYSTLAAPPFTVSSNGVMSLVGDSLIDLAGDIPDGEDPNLTLAPYWDDLETRPAGVCYGVTGTAPNRRFVVEWSNAMLLGESTSHLTFEAVIDEVPGGHNNVIDFIYQTMTNAETPSVAGIENVDGTLGTTIGSPFTTARVVRFTPMPM